jgi:predicted Zn-dependent protease
MIASATVFFEVASGQGELGRDIVRAMSRLETLRRIAAQRPTDPFPQYGLALELRSEGKLDEAIEVFTALRTNAPDYVPQYLMHGQVLIALERKDDAKAVLTEGLAVAQKKGDGHAAGEIEGALAEL